MISELFQPAAGLGARNRTNITTSSPGSSYAIVNEYRPVSVEASNKLTNSTRITMEAAQCPPIRRSGFTVLYGDAQSSVE